VNYENGRHAYSGTPRFLPLCGAELRIGEGSNRPLVADVGVHERVQTAGAVSVLVRREDGAGRRNFARVWGIVRPEIAVAVHGEYTGKPAQAGEE